jgi:uncharacterized glyoxalase superfamily protein PhnB
MSDELDLVRRLCPEAEIAPGVLDRARGRLAALVAGGEPGRAASPPPGTPQIIPHLPYEDVATAVEWLERAFGFREREGARIVSPTGQIHTAMELGSGQIMLGAPGGHGAYSPKRTGSLSQLLTVYVENVDLHHERARTAGARIVAALEDKFYGERVYEALDLEGHRWSFHQYTGRRFGDREWAPGDEDPSS